MATQDKENLIKAAHAGGAVLREYFGKTLNVVEKSTAWDFQTEADINAEKAILEVLKEACPTYNILSEESGKIDKGSEYTLVIDPLDGTNNFVMGLPNFSVSIALMQNGKSLMGVVYQPILNQTYFAEKDNGAFLNDKRINVNNVTDPKKITIAHTCGYQTDRNEVAKLISDLVKSDHKRVVFTWSPAFDFCLLALGRIESIVSQPGLEIYDMAAGKLIALEAGAKIITFDGQADENYLNDNFIISNTNEINKYILGVIKSSK